MFIFRKFFKTETPAGFSLGEVLLAGFVLTVGLLSISALMAKSLKNSFENRDSIIAVELAQEGVELVRNVRDNSFIADADGFAKFSGNKHCRIDYNDPINNLNCNSSLGVLSWYSLQYSNGFYEHSGGSGRFSRYLYVDYNGTNTATVRSFVYWGGGASGMFALADVGNNGTFTNCTVAKKCVYTEINLTNWK